MTDLSKLVFDTANSLNKTYLEGMKQGKKMEVKKMQLSELLNGAVNIADDVGQFQENLIEQIETLLDVWYIGPNAGIGSRTMKKDWEDFLHTLKREAGQD